MFVLVSELCRSKNLNFVLFKVAGVTEREIKPDDYWIIMDTFIRGPDSRS